MNSERVVVPSLEAALARGNVRLPLEHGGSGAPDGDDWVWSQTSNFGGNSPEDTPEYEDTRLFHAPPMIADQVVRAVNAFDDLVEALEMVADADDDCRSDGLPTLSAGPRKKIDAALAKARRP